MRPTGKAKRPLDRRTPGTKGRDNQPWPACSWGLPGPSDSGRPLRGQLQEDAHDLGGGARSARPRSVRFALGDYYGSPPVGPGHFCGSTGVETNQIHPQGAGLTIVVQRAVCYCGYLRRPIARTLAACCTTQRAVSKPQVKPTSQSSPLPRAEGWPKSGMN